MNMNIKKFQIDFSEMEDYNEIEKIIIERENLLMKEEYKKNLGLVIRKALKYMFGDNACFTVED